MKRKRNVDPDAPVTSTKFRAAEHRIVSLKFETEPADPANLFSCKAPHPINAHPLGYEIKK